MTSTLTQSLPRLLLATALLASGLMTRAGSASDLHVGPYLQYPTPESIVVMWETVEPVDGKVELRDGDAVRSFEAGGANKIQEVKVDGLKPLGEYAYRIHYGDRASEWHAFTSAPDETTRHFRICVYGDNRSNPEGHRRIAEFVRAEKPLLVLNSGDLIADGFVYEQWKNEYFDPAASLLATVPTLTVLGNHERNAPHYYQYMSLPGNEQWWSMRYANIHFIGLDSNIPTGRETEQYEWLVRELEGPRSEWTIVMFHHPAFSFNPQRGVNSTRWDWQPVFQQYNVDIVLVGHDHQYGRTYDIGSYSAMPQRGVVHVTSGGGGAGLYPVYEYFYSASTRACHNSVTLDFDGDRVIGRAYDIDGNGIDAFVIDQRSVPSPDQFVSYEMIQLEKDLTDQVANEPATRVVPDDRHFTRKLQSDVTFQAPLIVESRPGQVPAGWTIHVDPAQQTLEPNQKLEFEVRAERDYNSSFEVAPTVELTFTPPAPKEWWNAPLTGFRNNTLELAPWRFEGAHEP